MMSQFFEYVFQTLMYHQTGNDAIDAFVYFSSFFMELAAVAGVVIIVLKDESLRKRRRGIDRLVFWACVLVFIQNVLEISLVPIVNNWAPWLKPVYNTLLVINEALYLAIILQWLICVDYSLNHSMDHIRRRYRHAAYPIIVVTALYIIDWAMIAWKYKRGESYEGVEYVIHVLVVAVEIAYILTAVVLVKRHGKERREPRFLRLEAFIIPFVIGVLIRFYDAPMLGFGIIFTYAAMSRRDKYIDIKTDFYNSGFLDCISEYWDKNGYTDASAILAATPGHEDEMAGILSKIGIQDCYIIKLENGCFVLVSHKVGRSALQMTEGLLKDAAQETVPSFKVDTRAMNRTEGQTMKEFAGEIRREASLLAPPKEGGNGS